MRRDVYQSVTDSIINLLENDLPPWRKPWDNSSSIDSRLPFNAHTEVAPFLWTAKPDSISGSKPVV